MSNAKTHLNATSTAAVCGLPYAAAKHHIGLERFRQLLGVNGKDWFCQRCRYSFDEQGHCYMWKERPYTLDRDACGQFRPAQIAPRPGVSATPKQEIT